MLSILRLCLTFIAQSQLLPQSVEPLSNYQLLIPVPPPLFKLPFDQTHTIPNFIVDLMTRTQHPYSSRRIHEMVLSNDRQGIIPSNFIPSLVLFVLATSQPPFQLSSNHVDLVVYDSICRIKNQSLFFFSFEHSKITIE